MEERRELYGLLAQLLEYPQGELPAMAGRCRKLLGGQGEGPRAEAARLMGEFAAYAAATPPGRMEELYTATFDLSPECSPYVGYQLLGEDPKRAQLMVMLGASYRSAGFSARNELPDHVAVLLRFLAQQGDPDLGRDLMGELLAPALAKMAGAISERNVYGKVIRAAAAVMSDQ